MDRAKKLKEQEKRGTPPRPRDDPQEEIRREKEEEIKRMKRERGEALLLLKQLTKRLGSPANSPKSAQESAELAGRIQEQSKIVRDLGTKSRELEDQLVESQVQEIKSTPPKTPDSKGKGKEKEVAESFQDLQEKAERGESSSQRKRRAKKEAERAAKAEAIRFKELTDRLDSAIKKTNVKDVSNKLGPGTDETGVPVDELVLDDEAESSSRRGRSRVRRNEEDDYGRGVSPSKKVELDQGQQLVLFDNFDQGSPTKRARDENQVQEDQLRLEGSPEKGRIRVKSPSKKGRPEPPDVQETEAEYNERLDREQRERDEREAAAYLAEDQEAGEDFVRDQERLAENRRREQEEEQRRREQEEEQRRREQQQEEQQGEGEQQEEGEEGEEGEGPWEDEEGEGEDNGWQQVDRDDLDDSEEGEIEQNTVIKENDDGRRIRDDEYDEERSEEEEEEEPEEEEKIAEEQPVEAPPRPEVEPAAGFLGDEPVNQEEQGDIGTNRERMAGGGGGIGNEGGINITINNGGAQPAPVVGEGGGEPAAVVGDEPVQMELGEQGEIDDGTERGKQMMLDRAGPSGILQELTENLPDQPQAQEDLAGTVIGIAQLEALAVQREKLEQEQHDLRKQLEDLEKGKARDIGRVTLVEEDVEAALGKGRQNERDLQFARQQLEDLFQRTEERKRDLDERLTAAFNVVLGNQQRLAEQFEAFGINPLQARVNEIAQIQTRMNEFISNGGVEAGIRTHTDPIRAELIVLSQRHQKFSQDTDDYLQTVNAGLERLKENQAEIVHTLGLLRAERASASRSGSSPPSSPSSPTYGAGTFGQPNLTSTPSLLHSLGGGGGSPPPPEQSSFFGGGTPFPESSGLFGGGGGAFAPGLAAASRMATGAGNPLAGDRTPGVNPPGGFLQEVPPVDDGLNGQLGKAGLVFLQQIKNTSKNTGTENNEKIGKTLDKLLKVFQPIVNRRKPFKTVEELMKEWKLKMKGTKKLSKALKDTKKKKKVRKLLKKIQGKK